MVQKNKLTRRLFISGTGMAAAGLATGFPVIIPARARVSTAANSKVRIGVLGTGTRGRFHVKAINQIPNGEVVAVCDNFQPHLEAGLELAGGPSKAQAYTDYREMIARKDIDAVTVATPIYLHHDHEIAAMKAGKHVMGEKTLAFTPEQCRDIVRTVKETGLVFVTGHQRRYSPVYRKAMEMIAMGIIGEPLYIRAQWHRNGDWRRPVPEPKEKWERHINHRMYRDTGGGLMAELGSHQLDVANWAVGESPFKVCGIGGIDRWKDGRETFDNVSVVFAFPGGSKMIYSSICSNAFYGASESIMGTEGTIELTTEGGKFYREKSALTQEHAEAVGGNADQELQREILVTGATVTAEMASDAKGEEIGSTKGQVMVDDGSSVLFEEWCDDIQQGNTNPASSVRVGCEACVPILQANTAMYDEKYMTWNIQDYLG